MKLDGTGVSDLADEVIAAIDKVEQETAPGLAEEVRRRLNARGVWPHAGAPSVADPEHWDAGL